MSEETKWRDIARSDLSARTVNQIRNVVDKVNIPTAPADKPLIPLSVGDPTVYGNLPPPPQATAAITKAVTDGKYNGYAPAVGHKHVRDAIAAKYSHDNLPLTASDVFVTSGCSGAVQVAMHAVACKGENVLLPQPGFSLYHTLAGNAEIESRSYQCLPNQRWEIDLKNMDALVDEKTRAIVVNNPGNPCGSNYSREHLEAVAAFAQKHQLVVIADEVYGRMVFPGEEFVSFASVTTDVPVITTAGLAKMYCVPGWRVGWAVVHDKHERMGAIRDGMQNLCSVLLGANTIAQSIVPSFLNDTPESYFATQQATLYENAQAFYGAVSEIDGLNPIKPQGAMYLMIEIEFDKFNGDFKTDREFVQMLLDEEFVFCLPGECFGLEGFVRVVFAAPVAKLKDASDRMKAFCDRHRK